MPTPSDTGLPDEPSENQDEGRHRKKQKPDQNFVLSDTAANWIIGTVTAMWALNILAGVFAFNGYQPSEVIHGVFMTIVGGAFMLRIRGS